MPMFHLHCEACGENDRRLLQPDKVADQVCKKCGEKMEREFGGPSTTVVERLDNGAMPKVLERLAEAPRLFRERAEQHKREKDPT